MNITTTDMKQTRRRYLASAGTLGLAALAGCSQGQSSPTDAATDTPTDTATDTPTDTATETQAGGSTSGEQTPLIVMYDTVLAAETTAEGQAPCSLTNRFLHGQKVIFRVNVINPDTGEEMGTDALSRVAVDIKNGGGQTVEANYGKHPPQQPMDEYWVAPWTVPDSFPAGPVDFSIVAEDGREAKTYGFDIPPSSLTVLEGTYSGGSGSGGSGSPTPTTSN
ncbi:MAG: hypothetical protein ABEJ23_00385 [Haloarculaceae archaeon]